MVRTEAGVRDGTRLAVRVRQTAEVKSDTQKSLKHWPQRHEPLWKLQHFNKELQRSKEKTLRDDYNTIWNFKGVLSRRTKTCLYKYVDNILTYNYNSAVQPKVQKWDDMNEGEWLGKNYIWSRPSQQSMNLLRILATSLATPIYHLHG